MKMRFLSSMVLIATLAACGSDSNPTGSDLCSKATTVINNFNSKNTACIPAGQGPTAPDSTCTASLAQCSSSDQAILNTFLDCLNGTPACTTATASAWSTQVTACEAPIAGVSQVCKTATGAGT